MKKTWLLTIIRILGICKAIFINKGLYDSTNVIDRPIAVGITLLDYDHVKVLGHTIEEIAWHKAGIMKPGTVALVNPNQPPSANNKR